MSLKYESPPPFYDRISPRQAQVWLAHNHNNRSLKEELVSKYERKMRNNEWIEKGGDPIMVTAEGELINGQHRLTALQRVGFPMILKIQVCKKNPRNK